MEIPILKGATAPASQPVEVCRSFAYKLNLQNHGGPAYESADFFASRKMQAAPDDVAWVSQQIFEECVAEVREAVRLFIEEMKARAGARIVAQKERRTA
jgi:hypothetical protein